MSGIGAKVSGLRPKRDARKYTKGVHQDLTKIWDEAARHFVEEVVNSGVAIDTGMSAGSLVPLATKLRIGGQTRSDIASKRKRSSRKGYAHSKSGRRSLNAGIKLGGKAFKLSYGSVKRTQFLFEFDTVVFQHSFHEPRWKSLERGRKAFISNIRSEYKKYFANERTKLKGLL